MWDYAEFNSCYGWWSMHLIVASCLSKLLIQVLYIVVVFMAAAIWTILSLHDSSWSVRIRWYMKMYLVFVIVMFSHSLLFVWTVWWFLFDVRSRSWVFVLCMPCTAVMCQVLYTSSAMVLRPNGGSRCYFAISICWDIYWIVEVASV